MRKPETSEYHEFYLTYTSKVPDGDILQFLETQLEDTLTILKSVDEAKSGYRYAPGKWSIKELMGHLTDTERLFSYRAMGIARNDPASFPGMDQDDYINNGKFDNRSFQSLVEEFRHLRLANLQLFSSFDEEVSMREGIASDRRFTVRALVCITAGHVQHHLEVLRERYLN